MRARGFIAVAVLVVGMSWPAATASAGGGCHGPASDGQGETVALVKACFDPSVLRVDPGTEVTFLNKDPITHNVSAVGWGSPGDLVRGESFTTTFEEEGTFPYACMYHYGMTGAVVVGDGAGATSSQPVDVGPITESAPLSKTETAAVSSETSAGSSFTGWALAGGIGVILGAGVMALIRRRQPLG